jgi:hypothetical protein
VAVNHLASSLDHILGLWLLETGFHRAYHSCSSTLFPRRSGLLLLHLRSWQVRQVNPGKFSQGSLSVLPGQGIYFAQVSELFPLCLEAGVRCFPGRFRRLLACEICCPGADECTTGDCCSYP